MYGSSSGTDAKGGAQISGGTVLAEKPVDHADQLMNLIDLKNHAIKEHRNGHELLRQQKDHLRVIQGRLEELTKQINNAASNFDEHCNIELV